MIGYEAFVKSSCLQIGRYIFKLMRLNIKRHKDRNIALRTANLPCFSDCGFSTADPSISSLIPRCSKLMLFGEHRQGHPNNRVRPLDRAARRG